MPAKYMGEDDPALVDIRRRAQDCISAQDWQAVVEMETELRYDSAFWVSVWGPSLAIATSKTGNRDPFTILDELIDSGFSQPELFEPDLSSAFSDAPGWNARLDRMRHNIPPPPVTLTRWPTTDFVPPLSLDSLDESRAGLLRDQVPRPLDTAWSTALSLLAWASSRWRHANDHVAERDAVEILRRVDEGSRFACVEYSVVLTQALCAVGIPARCVDLLAENYHTGLAKGHVVTEAWIDELNTWVLLDGQNGMYWGDTPQKPAGLRELQDAHRSGKPPMPHHCVGSQQLDASEAATWWMYFAFALISNTGWGEEFVPIMQTESVIAVRLLHDPALLYPDLSGLSTEVVNFAQKPALKFHSVHPFVTGYQLNLDGETVAVGLEEPWPLPLERSGAHSVRVAATTRYAVLTESLLTFTVAGRVNHDSGCIETDD